MVTPFLVAYVDTPALGSQGTAVPLTHAFAVPKPTEPRPEDLKHR
jgi:hypothetical protein